MEMFFFFAEVARVLIVEDLIRAVPFEREAGASARLTRR